MSDDQGRHDQLDEDVELALRARIVGLEEWRPAVDEALGLLGIGLLAMLIAGVTALLILRKKAQL